MENLSRIFDSSVFYYKSTLPPSWRNDINNPLRLYYIFSDEWLERRLKYVWGRKREERKAQIRQAIMQERQDIMNNLLKQPKTWYLDQDGDRYHSQVRQSVERPGAKWTLSTRRQDCDDNNPEAYTLLKWYKDNDGDGYHGEKVESCGKPNTTDTWVNKTKGEDCDDTKRYAHKKNKCGKCAPNPLFGECKEGCEVKYGLLHEANFKDKKTTFGYNTTIATDNFRNRSWSIIQEVDCGNGKIPKGSIVNVPNPKPIVRTLANGTKLNYYWVHYEDCKKGNNKNNHNYDPNKPCSDCFKGNPVKGDMNLAKQSASGLKGATMGWTRKRFNNLGKLVAKQHKGVDIETEKGDPIYAMFDGTARLKTNTDEDGNVIGAGYYVAVTSKVGGKTIQTWYFHMQKDTRVFGEVKAGDIIGYQGDSGNLKIAVAKKYTPIHVHIQMYEDGKLIDPMPYFKATLNKTTGNFTNESDCQ